MSKTIDEKVVQMKFDNAQFEQNVSKSLKTLDELKFKLKTMDFRKSASSLESVGDAARKIDMSGLSQGIETVHAKFSALQVMGVTALANITNSAVNAGKKIASSLTDSLINGGRNRAQKIKDAKFTMEGLLGKEEYDKQWSRIDQSINYAVADTAYGYDSAARAASQFLASSVKVGDEMDRSLRAISGVAAMTNSTYDDISNIFTRVAGQGRVMAVDLNSLAARGLNAAAILGKSLNKSESEVRDMVSKGKISFQQFADAMDASFGEHAKEGNKTFQGALANMKAAMSRIGAKVWDPLLDNQRDVFNQMRLLINDLNNNYLNGPINSLNEKLTGIFQGLVKFFELGGVKNILLGIGNVLSFVSTVIKPVKEAFREVFPKKSIESLVEYTTKFKDFTAKIKMSDSTAQNLKATFKGLFSVMSTGLSVVKSFVQGFGRILSNLTGVPGGILGITGAMGNWLTKLSEAIKQSGIFSNVINGFVNIFENATNKFKEFTKHLDIFGGLVNGIKSVFTMLGKMLSEFGKMVGEALRTGDIKAALDVFNTSIFSGLLLNIKSITKSLDLFFRKVNTKSFTNNITLAIGNLKDCLYAFQFDIKADALIRIAKALAILAGSLLVLSLIKPDRLASALTGMGIAIAELIVALKALDKFAGKSFKDLAKLTMVASVIKTLSTSLLILSVALKVMGSLDLKQMAIALAGMGTSLFILCKTLSQMSKYEKDVMSSAKVIRKLATSLVVLAVALKIMGSMDIKQMGVALLGMTAGLIAMTVAINKMPVYKKGEDKIASMTKIAFSLILLGAALKILGSIGWPNILVALGGMTGALAILVTFVYALPKDLKQLNAKVNALNSMALGLGFLGFILKDLGKMSWDAIQRSLVAMGGALGEILIFLKLLDKSGTSLKGTSAMIGLASGILILGAALKVLSSLGWAGIAVSLVALAGAFTVLGVAGLVLKPLIPTLLALAGAMALFGAGMMLFGGGVIKLAAGIAALAAALTGGVTIIVAGIQAIILGVAQLIPELIKIFGESITTLCKVIMTSAPMIVETALVVLHETLQSLVDHGPEIVSLLFQFLIGILKQLKEYTPDFIVAAMEVIGAVIEGVMKGIKELDPSKVLPATLAIGALTGIMIALAALSHMIPQAMVGVLGLGVLIAELAVVLAAIGGLSKIPGIKELVASGGDFLQTIGTAIGQFIGGIYGGVAKGFTASMPDIGKNLSDFAKNLEPFINVCRTIDKTVLTGVSILAAAILEMTAANLYANIAKFITLGSSYEKLGEDLSKFMNNAKDFIEGAKQLKPDSMKGVMALTEVIVKMTNAGLMETVNKWAGGKGSLETFGSQLKGFAEGLKEFSDIVVGINTGAIIQAARAADGLVDLSNKVPNRDGLKQWFGGKQSLQVFGGELKAFGEGLKEFCDSIVGLNTQYIDQAVQAADKLIELSNRVPNREGMKQWFSGKKSLKLFGGELEAFAKGLLSFSDITAGLNIRNMTYATQCTDVLIDLTNKVPNRQGMAQWFTGKKSLQVFGGELVAFGEGLKSFSDSVKDLNIEPMEKATKAAEALVELTHKVPNRAGMAQWFTGKKSLEIFGGELVAFGEGLKSFHDSMKDANIETITKATEAAKGLVTLTNTVPNRQGMALWFTGKKSLEIFGGELVAFGEGLKSFNDSMKDANTDNIAKSAEAAKGLVELSNIVPNRQGMAQWFTGKQSLGIFGGELEKFGEGLAKFCEKIKDVKMDNMGDVVGATKTLAEATNALPEIKGKDLENRAWGFGEGIQHIANGLSEFMNKMSQSNFNIDTINSAVQAVKILSETFNNLPDKDGGKIENRGWGLATAIDHFANGISSFIEKLKGTELDPNYITSVATSIKTMSEAVQTLPTQDGGKIENRAWGLARAMTHFGNGFADFMSKLTESGYDAEKVRGAAETIKLMAEAVNSLPQKDGGKIENRAWGLGRSMTHFGNGLKDLTNNITESNFDPEKAKSAAEVVKIFSEAVSALPDKDGGKIENRAWGLGSAITHFSNGLRDLANNLNGSNFDAEKAKSAAEISKVFTEVINALPDKDGGKIENRAWGLGAAITHFSNGLKDLSNNLNGANYNAEQAKSAAEVVKTFGEIFNSLPDKDGGTIENRAWGLGESIKHFGNGLKDFCGNIADATFEKVSEAIAHIKAFADLIPSIPDNAGARLSSFAQGISALAPKFAEFISGVQGIDFTNVDASFANIKKLLESLNDISNFNMDNINGVGTALTTVADSLTKLAEVPADVADNFNNALRILGENGVTSFLDTFKNLQDDMRSKATDGINGFTSGINDNQGLATTALENLHKSCKEQIKPDEYDEIGKQVVAGFARGISNNQKLATDAMSQLTAKVEAQARKDLDIHSPSKLFKEIGSRVPQGFAQGISKFGNLIKNSVSHMSNTAVQSAKSVLLNINDTMTQGLDDNLTLRPIVDLSNVEASAQRIGSLFGAPSLAVAGNLGSIDYGMRVRNQNQNGDVISAINKLGSKLGNNGDTYNINGISYDDGSEVSDAVKTLVRAVRIERRT